MSKTVFIFGHHHCGTTILRTILGHIEGAKTFLFEADPIEYPNFEKDAALRVFKNPEVKETYFSDTYQNIIRIFLVRDPVQVLSSINRRYQNDPPRARRTVRSYLRMAHIFVRTKKNPPKTLHHIRYEDMFVDGYKAIRDVLDKHSIKHDDNIFQNHLYKNLSHEGQSVEEVPKNKPEDTNHQQLRLYQVNQPFQNNNNPLKVCLQACQAEALKEDENVIKMYPEIIEKLQGVEKSK